MDLVKTAWDNLSEQNPLLRQYKLQRIEEALVQYHVTTNSSHVDVRENKEGDYLDYINTNNPWKNKMARPIEDERPGNSEEDDE